MVNSHLQRAKRPENWWQKSIRKKAKCTGIQWQKMGSELKGEKAPKLWVNLLRNSSRLVLQHAPFCHWFETKLSSIHGDHPRLHYLINFLKRGKIVKILDFHSMIKTCASATYHLTQILQNIPKNNPILSLKTIFGRFDSGKQNHAFFINISCTKFQIC